MRFWTNNSKPNENYEGKDIEIIRKVVIIMIAVSEKVYAPMSVCVYKKRNILI